jgi:hypothetical protein
VRIGALRATLLLHFGRPHGSSEALTAAVKLGQSLRSLGHKRVGSTEEAAVAAYYANRNPLIQWNFNL